MKTSTKEVSTDILVESALPKTVEGLLEAAKSIAGLTDFGDLQFMSGLNKVVEGFRTEAQLTTLGEQMAYGGLLNMLVNRLRYVRDIQAHPEILAEKIVSPIVVLGLPRTGTTKLQRILSADPQNQSMAYWRMMNPAPFPDEVPGHPDGRIAAAEAVVQMLADQFPGFMARHPTEALQPDEEVLLMQGSFQCVVTWLFARMPSFYDYVMRIDQRPTYQFLHDQMQYLQWQDGGGRGRPWVLKSPCHTGMLDSLLAVFPDAVLINCHRDVTKVIPSIAALVKEMRSIHSEPVDAGVIGQEMLDYFGASIDRYLQLRDQLPQNRIIDVSYDEVLNNVVDVVARIYARSDSVLTAQAIAEIQAHEAERPQHQFGSYSYAAADFGISHDMIRDRFADYQQRFAEYIFR